MPALMSFFSADAFGPAFLVGTAKQVDHLQTVWVPGMIDVLVYGLGLIEYPG